MARVVVVLTVWCLLLLGSPALAQQSPAQPSERECPSLPRISVLTFDPGDDLFAAFGHIALVVRESEDQPAKVYNFGNYDFARSDAKWRYARGYLDYWVSVSTLASTLASYRDFNRGATLRDLALTREQATSIIQALDRATLPHNRFYRYHHTTNNCCTKVRDLVDESTAGLLRSQFGHQPASTTYRGWTRVLLQQRPLILALVDFALGPSFDKPISRYEEEFLPLVLSADLDAVVMPNGGRLVCRKEQVLPSRSTSRPSRTSAWILPSVGAAFGALCLALAWVGARPWTRRLLGACLVALGMSFGLVGALLVFLRLGVHTDAHGNANVLVAPATHLWLVEPGVVLMLRGGLGPRLARSTWCYLLAALGGVVVTLAATAFGYQNNVPFVVAGIGLEGAVVLACLRIRLESRTGR